MSGDIARLNRRLDRIETQQQEILSALGDDYDLRVIGADDPIPTQPNQGGSSGGGGSGSASGSAGSANVSNIVQKLDDIESTLSDIESNM